ncbi:taste receptor type 2 member 41-like [Bufo gargarizans]|uniref:taste receptor type 2 member 41-like n=1 Tax=Bufo gargarizans TaxID=30331 RepID=UPI001CF49233|nr:taste receptor type 2 member 41-like [Bufo gargarizans]
MMTALGVFWLILLILTGMSGTFLNSLVVVMCFGLWRRMSDLCNFNGILLIIGLVNLFYQWCLTLDNVFKYSDIYETFDKRLCLCLFYLQFTLVGVSLWNTAWLAIFYCVRLLNYSHWLFLQVKEKFSSFLPQLMVGSVLWSAFITMPLFWETTMEIAQNQTEKRNVCHYNVNAYYIILRPTLGFCIPFLLTCLSIGLSVRTLVRHINRMRKFHITSPQLQGHFRAAKVMVTHVYLEISFSVVIIIRTCTLRSNSIIEGIYWANILLYPTSQALILIFGNPNLKRKLFACLTLWKCLENWM